MIAWRACRCRASGSAAVRGVHGGGTCAGAQAAPERARSAGCSRWGRPVCALFVVIEVGYQALGTVELGALSDAPGSLVLSGRAAARRPAVRDGGPGVDRDAPRPAGRRRAAAARRRGDARSRRSGLHSFAEGLSVGQSMATSLAGPGALVVLGVALHSLVDGAVVAAPVVGQPMSPRPRVPARGDRRRAQPGRHHRRHVVGGTRAGAAGALARSGHAHLRAPRAAARRLEDVSAVGAMWALVIGMLLGLGCGAGDRAGTVTAGCARALEGCGQGAQGAPGARCRVREVPCYVVNKLRDLAGGDRPARDRSIPPRPPRGRSPSSGDTPPSRSSRRPISRFDLLNFVARRREDERVVQEHRRRRDGPSSRASAICRPRRRQQVFPRMTRSTPSRSRRR